MADNPPGNALLQTTPSDLLHHAGSLVRKAAEELELVSQDRICHRGSTKRILFITDPMSETASLISHLLHGRGISCDIMPRHNQGDPDNVYERLVASKYDLLIPSNLELSPFYIPGLVSAVRQMHPTIKILVISGWHSPEFFQDLTTRGIHDFVLLPMRAEDLQERIFRLLPGHSDKEENEIGDMPLQNF